MKMTLIALLTFSLCSCSWTGGRTIEVVEQDPGHAIVLTAKHTVLVSAEGLFWSIAPSCVVQLKTTGVSARTRGIPGRVFYHGKDFTIDASYIDGGYIWTNDALDTIGVALYSVDPQDGLTASYFNGSYALSATEAELLKRVLATLP